MRIEAQSMATNASKTATSQEATPFEMTISGNASAFAQPATLIN